MEIINNRIFRRSPISSSPAITKYSCLMLVQPGMQVQQTLIGNGQIFRGNYSSLEASAHRRGY